jgi:hypothetical protein
MFRFVGEVSIFVEELQRTDGHAQAQSDEGQRKFSGVEPMAVSHLKKNGGADVHQYADQEAVSDLGEKRSNTLGEAVNDALIGKHSRNGHQPECDEHEPGLGFG